MLQKNISKVSICVSTTDPSIDDIVVKSILCHSQPYEIILANGQDSFCSWIDGVKISVVIATDEEYYYNRHSGGLHRALEAATGEYILFTDYDVIFLSDVISYYLFLMNTYSLSIVGCSHYYPQDQCYLNFPCIINCLVKREELPGPDFLLGDLRMRSFLRYGFGVRTDDNDGPTCDGKWLAPSPILKYHNLYPHPGGFFDAGHNLWLWNYWKGGKWLSFLPVDGVNLYSTSRFDSNLIEGFNLENRDLIWHQTGQIPWESNPYTRAYL